MNAMSTARRSPHFLHNNKVTITDLFLAVSACGGFLISFIRAGITAAIFYSFFFIIYAFLLSRTIKALKEVQEPQSNCVLLRHPMVISAGAALATGIVLEFLTLHGAPASNPFAFEDWSKKRFIIYTILCFPFTPYAYRLAEWVVRTKSSSQQLAITHTLRPTIPMIVLTIPVISCIAALACGVTTWHSEAILERALFLLLTVIIGFMLLIWIRKKEGFRPEIVFLIISLTSTSFLSYSLPTITRISWDDQIHLDRSLGLSYLLNSQHGRVEDTLVGQPEKLFSDPDQAVQNLIEAYRAEIANGDVATTGGFRSPVAGESLLTLSTVGYSPSAIGLWLGRTLNLPINGVLILGRLSNALFYCVTMTFAIRIVPIKKTLLLSIGLLPTSLFLASNYSYDPWVIAFLSLGIAMIIRERLTEGALSQNRILLIALALFLGLCPKAIYFPVIALMYLIPSSRFIGKKSYRRYCLGVFLFGCIMFASFSLPMIFSSDTQAGDTRGGGDVSAIGQILFFFSSPWQFIRTILQFLQGYIFTNSSGYSLSYAYLLSPANILPCISNMPLLFLTVISILDSQKQSAFKLPQVLLLIAVFFFATFMVAVSLYVSFTPVGYSTVNGCQPRYLLPILFIPLATLRLPASTHPSRAKTFIPLVVNVLAILACNAFLVCGAGF